MQPEPNESKQRTLEMGIADQAAFLRSVLEGSTEHAIIASDLEGLILAWSEGAQRIYGYDADDVIGKSALLLHHPLDVATGRARALLAEARAVGKWEGSIRHVRQGGGLLTARVTLILRRSAEGTPAGLTIISRDLTGSEAQPAPRQRETGEASLLNSILESSTEHSIIATDLDGNILAWNEGAKRAHGYSADEMVGRCNADVLQAREEVASGRARRALELALGTGKFEGESQRIHKNGRRFPVQVAITTLRDASNAALGFVLISKEITAQNAIEEQLRQKLDELEQQNRRVERANRLKSELLANVSHELRTPLNGIIGFSELMHSGKAGPIAEIHREYLGDVLTSARHLLRLTNDVLDLAKVESGKVDFHAEPIQLSHVVGEVRDVVSALASQKRILVDVAVEPEIEHVFGDAAKLKQILYNYLANALKFTPKEGRVWVRCVPADPGFFCIEVEDTGIGIRPEDMSRLFVEFQQLDASPAKQYPGTGLGLALTKRVAEAQGGSVDVRSTLGKGSVFMVRLPRALTAQPDNPGDLMRADAHPGRPGVLGVEDAGRDRAPSRPEIDPHAGAPQ